MQLPRSAVLFDSKWLRVETEEVPHEEDRAFGLIFSSAMEAIFIAWNRAFLVSVGPEKE